MYREQYKKTSIPMLGWKGLLHINNSYLTVKKKKLKRKKKQ